ncbi:MULTISPECIES: alpha/beta hydrolase [Nocardiaceae]|uniref:Dienelactone hydrolase n=1 Tax=Rhodococcoides corynebacterioides TaxID=53972 RepID=A0ABS2KV79_9NOCA|nr:MULTISPECIES: alpha/beta hydrolase [Rhodococcus]MBM7415853.1 dienelactone hydrolase [Rhodococcus corynebacterioides]MBP1118315.1 dienelactone hydrolase [Rhodococcus sp. PvP016]
MRTRLLGTSVILASLAASTVLSAPAATADPTVTTFTFPVEGTSVSATRYAEPSASPRPVLVMALGLGSTQDKILPEVAPEFVAAGYDVVTFDYRYWGSSAGQPRNLIDIDSQLEDWRAAVGAARSLPGVDGTQIGLWGTSLSGGHVLSIGSENIPGVRAVVAQAPHVNGIATVSTIPVPALAQLTAVGTGDLAGSVVGREPIYIPIAAEPGTLGLLPEPGALQGYRTVLGESFDNRATARTALQIPFYSPNVVAQAGRAPTFIATGRQDNITPPAAARELAARMGAAGRDYPGGHFDVYPGGQAYPELIVDEIAFLHTHLPTS